MSSVQHCKTSGRVTVPVSHSESSLRASPSEHLGCAIAKEQGHIMIDDAMVAYCCRVSQLLCCFFFFARPTLSVTGGSGDRKAAKYRVFGTVPGVFLRIPYPKPLARSSGRRPGFPCRHTPNCRAALRPIWSHILMLAQRFLRLALFLAICRAPSSLSRAHAASNSGSPSPRPLASKSETS